MTTLDASPSIARASRKSRVSLVGQNVLPALSMIAYGAM